MIPRPAVEHYRRMQRLQAGAAQAARRAWRSVDPQWISESWAEAVPDLSDAVAVRQAKAATMGAGYGADTLAAQGAYVAPIAFVNPRAFEGQSSLGLPLGNVIYSPAIKVKEWIGQGHAPAAALRMGGKLAESIAQTQVADAGRAAASVDTFARPAVMYTRMLNPPSCPRCSVLAGRVYRNNQGFMRHPRCDCVHVVTHSEAAAKSEGLVHDPYEYFESLSEAEQDRLYTKDGAQAIRDGADLFQVVNSRRGMSYAGVSSDGTRRGQRASMTTREGTTKRGYYGGTTGGFEKQGGRYMRTRTQRLTPDAIYARNLPREQTLDLLRSNGYLLSQGQVPEGAIRGLGSVIPKTDLTAAEQRVQTARLQWEAARDGRNPFGKGPVTPQDLATAENNYRRWLTTGGQIFTR